MKTKRRKIIFAIAVPVILFLHSCSKTEILLPSVVNDEKSLNVYNPTSGSSQVELVAGQTIVVGSILFEEIDTDNNGQADVLKITYQTTDDWYLEEIHFWIGTSLNQMPQTQTGNPQIGHFPYKFNNLNTQKFSFTIPFSILNVNCNNLNEYFVAAHASVFRLSNNVVVQGETAWGKGERITRKGNWAMYFKIFIQCDQPSQPQTTKTETAFAYDPERGTCFLDLGHLIPNPTRWGWTIGPLNEGFYTFDLYAAAGQCDINKGTKVGYVTLSYINGQVVVRFFTVGTNPVTQQPYTLDEMHVYIGRHILPHSKNGSYTLSPGQYPFSAEGRGATSYTFTMYGFSGPIYFIGHATVDGFPL